MTGPVHPPYPVRRERFALRPVRVDDLDAVHAHRSLPEVARYLPHEPHTREMTADTLGRVIAGESLAEPGNWLDLAVEDASGRVVGEVLLKRDEQPLTGEVGFAFHPDVHGTGIATEAVAVTLDIAFDSFGWRRIVGICNVENTASAALMRRIGMRHEAVWRKESYAKGLWNNFQQFAVLDSEWRTSPPPSADERAIDGVARAFFDAFTRRAGEPVDLNGARRVLAPNAVIERVAEDGVVHRTDVDEFLAPRATLLNGPSLTDFREVEAAQTTIVAGERAVRTAQYFKYGVRDGEEFSAWGRKVMQLAVSASGDWLIETLTWTDEPEPAAMS
ncbi:MULTISPECIES: GNAT family N-acetyltransferase [Streptomyces]|uniref:GNAT family N-acetyltransferase n=1 Tax=Streptomyces solicathayae TaxID=3081768 RepID=A0ABZ0M3B5_9ACTN|nr:GNAT family N-acetyltransferase [Streptomyces sp. HUAS YS2]WOX26275.1 GNAT family N-acetyltransferase [Streptomyces sp. HUAS YS2]